MGCEPTTSDEVVYPAELLLTTMVPAGSVAPLSAKVRFPVGTPKKGSAGVTAAVNVMVCPAPGGFWEAVSATLVEACAPSSTAAVLPPPPVATTSVRPSPLKSARASATGPVPAAKLTDACKVPSPLPTSTLRFPLPALAVTTSAL